MDKDFIHEHRWIFLIAFLAICMIAAFWIRTIAAGSFSYPDYLGAAEPDVWYNLRQIEVMVHNFPQYNWFDPMTAFPTGKSVDWGPLFTILASGLVILAGASNRPELMTAASYMGPIIGVALVPVVFVLGRRIWDTWAGVVAALFISVGTFSLYYRTTYGYIDHHGLEVLLSAIFVFAYIGALSYTKTHPVSRSDPHTLIRPALFAVLAGIVFVFGLLNMPTMVLFALIVAIATLIAFILHKVTGTSSEYLLFVNSITFIVVIIGLALIGIDMASSSISQYSFAQLLSYLFLIAGTAGLWVLGRFSKTLTMFFLGLVVLCVAVVALLFLSGSSILTGAFSLFFGLQSDIATIQEMQGYEVRFAILSYNYGLILAAAGGIILAWKTWVSKDFKIVFLLVWSLVMAIATLQHRRFEYYFAVNFALLSGVAVSWVFSTIGKDVLSYIGKIRESQSPPHQVPPDEGPGERQQTGKKSQKKAKTKKEPAKTVKRQRITTPMILKTAAFSLVIILVALFVFFSVNNDLIYAKNPAPYMTQQPWIETLLWLKDKTPTTGVDYFGKYDKATFTYPEEAYGTMAWWDYGHYITFIAERIPNTNPFQDNLRGRRGAAAFYIAQDEDVATRILSSSKSRFILTNTEIASMKFHAIAEWNNSTAGIDLYRKWFYIPDRLNKNQLNAVSFHTPEYFRTMVARLHLTDGSFTSPTTAYYFEYRESPDLLYPQIVASEEIEVSAGIQKAALYNSHAMPGTGAGILSSQIMYSLEELPALRHFRLVHESTADSSGIYAETADPRLRATPLIKVFEVVKGTRIAGEGTIEVVIVTNTGREFTYRQKSVDGEFVLPYSTTGNTWDVKTKGNYRIVETGREISVSEDDIH